MSTSSANGAIMQGLYFPAIGEFYRFLPYILRSQDSGFLLAFTELVRVAHNLAVEDSRLSTIATSPLELGKFVPEHFNESSDELNEFLDRVKSGLASINDPPATLRFSIASINRLRTELNLAATNVSSEVPLSDLVESVARRVIQTARIRHRTRGSKWLANNIARMIGLGDLRVIEYWSRATLSDPLNIDSQVNDDDLNEDPSKYPAVSDLQFPPGSSSWNPWDYSDSGTYETQTYDGLSIDPLAANYFRNYVNGHNPWVSIGAGPLAKPLVSGTYALTAQNDKFASVRIPYVDGTGGVLVSSILPGAQGATITLNVGIFDGQSFSIEISGPKSEIKYKSSIYALILYVDVLAATSLLEFDDQLSTLDLESLTAPLDLLLYEEFLPLTRMVRKSIAGIALRDQVNYAPYHPVKVLCLQDDQNTWWKVNPIPTIGLGNAAIEQLDGEPYILTVPTSDEIAEAQSEGEIIQWDWILGGFYRYELSGVGSNSRVTFTKVAGDDPYDRTSTVLYLSPWFVWVEDGRLEVRGVKPDEFTGYMLTGGIDDSTIRQYFPTVRDEIRDEVLAHMTEDAREEPVKPEIDFSDRPQDVLVAKSGILDDAGFYVEQSWGIDPGQNTYGSQTWWSYYDRESGADLRFRSAGIHTGLVQDPGLALATRDRTFGFFNRHGRYVWRDLSDPGGPNPNHPQWSVKLGDGTIVNSDLSEFDGPQEGTSQFNLPEEYPGPGDPPWPTDPWLVQPNDQVFESFRQSSGTYKLIERSNFLAEVVNDSGKVRLDLIIDAGSEGMAVPASIAIPEGPLTGIHEVDATGSSENSLLLTTDFVASANVRVLIPVGSSSSLESSGLNQIRMEFAGAIETSFMVIDRSPANVDTVVDVVIGESSSKQLLLNYPIEQGHQLLLYIGCSDSAMVLMTADLELEIGDLPGWRTWESSRDAIQVLKMVKRSDETILGTDSDGYLLLAGRHDNIDGDSIEYDPGIDPVAVSQLLLVEYDSVTNVSTMDSGDTSLSGASAISTVPITAAYSGTPRLLMVVAIADPVDPEDPTIHIHFDPAAAPDAGDLVNVMGTYVRVQYVEDSEWPQMGPAITTRMATAMKVTGPDLSETPANDPSLDLTATVAINTQSGLTTILYPSHGLDVGTPVRFDGERWCKVVQVVDSDWLVVDFPSGFIVGTILNYEEISYASPDEIGKLTFESILVR